MGNKIQRIYLGTDLIRPINRTFTYDFTTKTKAQATADGWVLDADTNLDSNGLYSTLTSSTEKGGYYIISGNITKSITVKFCFRSTRVGSWTGAALLSVGNYNNGVLNIGTIYNGLMTNTNYKLRWQQGFGDGVASNSISWSANTWYIGTLTINLENKTVSYSVATENTPSTAIVTVSKDISSTIANIQPINVLRIKESCNYVRVKYINAERE